MSGRISSGQGVSLADSETPSLSEFPGLGCGFRVVGL